MQRIEAGEDAVTRRPRARTPRCAKRAGRGARPGHRNLPDDGVDMLPYPTED